MSNHKFTAVIDKREQNPLILRYTDKGDVLPSLSTTLYTGDYSIKGLEKYIAIERKSLDDLMLCIGRERERFEKEIERLRGFEVKAIVVESSWNAIEAGKYRSKVTPSSAISSLLGWIASGIPIIMANTHNQAGIFVARIMYITASRRYKELISLL